MMTAVKMAKFLHFVKSRRYLVEDALKTEVFGTAQSLASDQFSLCHGTKFPITAILIQTTVTRKIQPVASSCVIKLSALLHKKQPSWVKTFGDFSKVLYHKIMDIKLKEGTRDTSQKMKFSIKGFSSKCDQFCSFLQIWSHLLEKSLMENFIFCAVRGSRVWNRTH